MIDTSSEQRLFETGTAINFKRLEPEIAASPDGEFIGLRVELVFEPDDPDGDPAEIVEWGGVAFLFVLASLSFHDARPRGFSEQEYVEQDWLTAGDFLDELTFGHRGLSVSFDYLRGRCLKTDITVRLDGSVQLETRGRGKRALRWLDLLQGKKALQLVATDDAGIP
jgi:hypothetical protein